MLSTTLIDDWELSSLTGEQRRDLLEILEDRHDQRSTIVTSQLPIDQWHGFIGDPTLADAILDRLVHNAYKINLKGESMRKKEGQVDSQHRHRVTIPKHRVARAPIGGSIAAVWVAAFTWNRWQESAVYAQWVEIADTIAAMGVAAGESLKESIRTPNG